MPGVQLEGIAECKIAITKRAKAAFVSLASNKRPLIVNRCKTCRHYDGTCRNTSKVTYDNMIGSESGYLSPSSDGLVVRACFHSGFIPMVAAGPMFGCVHHEADSQ